MNSGPEHAKALFDSIFNCAQSVFSTYAKEYFKDEASALRLASSFGAGISYRGETCGAVSGALMAIGLRYGYSDETMDLARDVNYMISKEFMDQFEKENGSLICNRLIGGQINTPEGLEEARANDRFKVCPAFVESASVILEKLFKKYPVEKLPY
ncbi:MAG TPA: C-GCAxxG-C-C family protein [Lentimicrobium sp.]|nr:C-GCAxxG-C-C family protein [Lentimicrobium sp.]